MGTLFESDGIVFRVVQTRAAAENGHVSYVNHFQYPDETFPADAQIWESGHDEVKGWHDASRAVLAQREDLQREIGGRLKGD